MHTANDSELAQQTNTGAPSRPRSELDVDLTTATMSLKIERDTVTGTVKDAVVNHVVNKGGFVGSTAAAISEAAHGQLPGTSGKHPISAVVGTALTGGRKNAGTKGYLAVRRPTPCVLSVQVATKVAQDLDSAG